jgi:hypothetical protein
MTKYDAIFTPERRKEILRAFPRDMFHNYQGYKLGDSGVWFDHSGKVYSLR